jgi:hypothetical protein
VNQAIAIHSWNVPYARSDRWLLRLLPSLTDLAFLIPAFLLISVLPGGLGMLLGDADTAWHIKTGEWILQHKAVPVVDLFSFTKPGQPWFAWEWAWDVLFASVHAVAGLAGVVLVNLIILCFVSALLFRLVRRACDHDLIALAVSTVAVGASVIHWLARPHLLSWVFLLIFLHILLRAQRGEIKLLRWTPLLMLFWTNIHGSFFVGVLMLFITATGEGLTALLRSSPDWRLAWRVSKPFWIYGLAAAAVTFINPYAWHVHAHIVSYLHDSALLDQIQEFQSANFHTAPALVFECLLLPGIAAAFWCFRNRNYTAAIGIIVWAHFALVAARNIPLFVFIASPAIACFLVELSKGARDAAFVRKPVDWVSAVVRKMRPFELVERSHAVSILLLVYFSFCFAIGRPGFEARFPKQFPASALATVKRIQPARIFTSDQWGDYFLYYFYPSTKVFVDGRSDFYGLDFIDRCRHILSARWDWETDLNRFMVDMVVVTPDTPVATVLKGSARWRTLFDDGRVVVFGRVPAAKQPQLRSRQPIRLSAVVRSGGKQLGVVLACKYRTTTYERRCL